MSVLATCSPTAASCDGSDRVRVLVFTETRLVLIESWLATAMGRVRLPRSAAFSWQWHRASTHSDPADRSSMPRR